MRASGGRPETLPDRGIVVAGVPRSGTSLMRDLLGSHPDVAMFPGELPLWRVLGARFAGRDARRPDVQQQLVGAIVGHPRMRRAGVVLDAAAVLAVLRREPPGSVSAVLAQAMRQYARQAGRPRWAFKDPLGEFSTDRILADLPHATIVHMIRDPRDVVASQRRMWGADAQHVVSTIDVWRRSAVMARRRQEARAPGSVAVRYEDLVADAPAVLRRVCDAAGLDYRPEMLALTARPAWWVVSGDAALRGRRDVFGDAVGRHVRDLGRADTGFIQLRAGAEMARWGYAPRPRPLTLGDRGGVAVRLLQEGAWRVLRAARLGRLGARGDQPDGGGLEGAVVVGEHADRAVERVPGDGEGTARRAHRRP
jgi:hypothetical protein